MANAVIQQAGTLAPTTLGSATVNATDAAPTTDADGVSCSGYSAVGVSLAAPSAGATCTLRPWVYLGGQWARVRDSAGALVEFSVGAETLDGRIQAHGDTCSSRGMQRSHTTIPKFPIARYAHPAGHTTARRRRLFAASTSRVGTLRATPHAPHFHSAKLPMGSILHAFLCR